jgi:hypothetical protein
MLRGLVPASTIPRSGLFRQMPPCASCSPLCGSLQVIPIIRRHLDGSVNAKGVTLASVVLSSIFDSRRHAHISQNAHDRARHGSHHPDLQVPADLRNPSADPSDGPVRKQVFRLRDPRAGVSDLAQLRDSNRYGGAIRCGEWDSQLEARRPGECDAFARVESAARPPCQPFLDRNAPKRRVIERGG